ncbi:phospholipase C [Kitasatospora sp. NPDC058965]|uniref:phospholipase C n=1 Tax=Kitasatospora sp. NPDC058965 TaxID=3346682 RepID=UPI0036BF5C81
MHRVHRSKRLLSGAAAVAAGLTVVTATPGTSVAQAARHTQSPIKHLVVIYQENVSFDHYFGTYPNATNTDGQAFTARRGTPAVNGLTGALLTANPNGVNPRRYDPAAPGDVLTCDQDHNYGDEQAAFDGGKMDRFPQTVGNESGKSPTGAACVAGDVMNYYDGNTVTAMWNYAQRFAMSDNSYGTTFGPSSPGAVNLIAGNTGGVDMAHTANSPSVATPAKPNADLTADGQGGYVLTSDAQPYWDDCSTRDAVAMSGKNVGDQLNAAGLSWGFFEGGFRPTTGFADAAAATGHAGQPTSTFVPDEFKAAGLNSSVPHSTNQGLCNAVHPVGVGVAAPLTTGTGQYGWKDDYIPHHQPFQYYASTANPHHVTLATDANGRDTRSALRSIGTDTQHYVNGAPQFDTPNHQYDTSDFDQLVAAIGRGQLPGSALPAVSYLKAAGYQDGHAAYSDPYDEQQFVVNEINALQKTPDWENTAVVIAYDDSDGWYDHAYSGVTNPSASAADSLTGPGVCGSGTPIAGQNGRCGYGPRLPLLVVSPWAKRNSVDHTLTDQSSILKFVEDNWTLPRIAGSTDKVAGSLNGLFDFPRGHGRGHDDDAPNARPLVLDPATGQPTGRR